MSESRPRSFYPDFTDQPPPKHGAPGWDVGPERRIDDGRTLARGLAWFSIGLGLFELMGARRLAGFLGIDERHTTLIRAYGVREIATGVGIMVERTPAVGVWSRVAGDALDMATLGLAFRRDEPRTGRVALAMLAVAGATAVDVICAQQLTRTSARLNARRRDGADEGDRSAWSRLAPPSDGRYVQ